MTKDELYDRFIECYEKRKMNEFIEDMDEFFSQNVVIPKGYNRHPYADVFHELAERPENVELIGSFHNVHIYKWNATTWLNKLKFRIKPKEPIYEWQWYVGIMYGIDAVTEGFYTEEEIGEFPFRKKEETKRLRK